MEQPVRIGIVGCGDVLAGAYASQIKRLQAAGRVEVLAACDLDAGKRHFVERTFPGAVFTTDFPALISGDVDLVMVLTAMGAHGPITRAALQAGKHVLVEKPMAVTLKEGQELVALAAQSPGYLVCAPFVLLSPTYREIWTRIRQGDVGKVVLARARYGWTGPWWGPWFYRQGGGVLFDLAVYNITSLTGLLGPARRVTAMTGTAIPERKVDGEQVAVEIEDNAHLLLDFGNSVFAVVTTGFTMQRYRSPAIELYGTEGTIQMLGDDWAPEGYEIWQNGAPGWHVVDEVDRNWLWTDGLQHAVDSIQHGVPPLIRPEHAYHVLEIMIKAQQAGKDGRARLIESKFDLPDLSASHERVSAHLVSDDRHERFS